MSYIDDEPDKVALRLGRRAVETFTTAVPVCVTRLVALRLGRRAVETLIMMLIHYALAVALRLGRRAVETKSQHAVTAIAAGCPKAWPKGR